MATVNEKLVTVETLKEGLLQVPFKIIDLTITSEEIDGMTRTGIYHAQFTQGTKVPFASGCGLMMVCNREDAAVEQVLFMPTGIGYRHRDTDAWSAWKTVGLT